MILLLDLWGCMHSQATPFFDIYKFIFFLSADIHLILIISFNSTLFYFYILAVYTINSFKKMIEVLLVVTYLKSKSFNRYNNVELLN
jgi:hypothetical protein